MGTVLPCTYLIPPPTCLTIFITGLGLKTPTEQSKVEDTQHQKNITMHGRNSLMNTCMLAVYGHCHLNMLPQHFVSQNTGIPDLTLPPCWVNYYHDLNANMIRDNFPLPWVDDILADCAKGKIFGKMDMTNSFFQTRVHPDDIHLTAVWTPWGLYEWTIMPMGGCNAPSTHQCHMTDALRELIGKICHVYLDDIIIWSQTVEKHEINVAKVLEALWKANLFCNGAKMTLFATEISFLGHKISAAGIQADPWKIDCILDWPQPTTAKNVRGILGLTQYIAAFLPALAKHTSVLMPLTTKECDQGPGHRNRMLNSYWLWGYNEEDICNYGCKWM